MAVVGDGGDGASALHVTELWPAAELVDIAVAYDGMNVAEDGLGEVDATAVELVDIGMVDNPSDITFALSSANALHAGTCHDAEATTVDVTFGIVIIGCCLRLVEASEVELVVVAAGDRQGWMWGTLLFIVLVATTVELLEPDIATHMEIAHPVTSVLLLGDPLLDNTALQNNRFL